MRKFIAVVAVSVMAVLAFAPASHGVLATQCPAGDTNCYLWDSQTTAISGTTITKQYAHWDPIIYNAPFTEIANVQCNAIYQNIPLSVISTYGTFTDIGPTGGTMTGSIGNSTVGGTAIRTISDSIWYLQRPSGSASTADTVTVTFGNTIPAKGCSLFLGYITSTIGLGAMKPTAISLTTINVNPQSANTWTASFTSQISSAGVIIAVMDTFMGNAVQATYAANAPLYAGFSMYNTGGTVAAGCTASFEFQTVVTAGYIQGICSYGFNTAPVSAMSYTLAPSASATWEALAWAIQFTPTTSTSATSQTQTVGSCPPGGGTGVGHYALTNNTIYFYNGNALGSEVVNTVQTEVQSIVGSGTHYLQLLIYASTSTPPSVQYPNTRLYESKVFAITTGTTNSTITLQIAVPLNGATTTPLPFNWWSVGIIGDDHIKIAGSSTSGLVTQTGTTPTGASVPPIQPTSFTTSGTSSANKLALCATGQYQSISAGLVVTTTVASGTVSFTTTNTQTVTSLGATDTALLGNTNFLLAIIIIIGPSLLMATATKSLWGGVLGATLGVAVGVWLAVVPFWAVVMIILVSLVVLFVGRNNNSGGM